MSQLHGKFIQDQTIGLGKLAQSSANTNEVIKWNGSQWIPSAPTSLVNAQAASNTLAGPTSVSASETLQDILNRVYGPSISQAPVFATDGTLTSVTFYSNATQVTANRVALSSMTYDSDLFPATETLTLYSTVDGTTILKTITRTFTFTSGVLTNVTQVTT